MTTSLDIVIETNSDFTECFKKLLVMHGTKVCTINSKSFKVYSCNQESMEIIEFIKGFDVSIQLNKLDPPLKAKDYQIIDAEPASIGNRGERSIRKSSISDTSGLKNEIDQEICKQLLLGQRKETTCMLRNIPNKYTPTMLREFINKTHHVFFILIQNNYDFFYLRMDFKNKCNVGYAFINFISPMALGSFAQRVRGHKWPQFNSEKIIGTCFADLQGIDSLVKKFRNSSVMLEDKEYRPMLFHSHGPLKGSPKEFPGPEQGKFRPKVDVLFSR